MCVCGDRCFQDYGIQILSCSSALARVSVYICVSAYCCICVPACCYKSCDVPRLFHGRVSHTSSYYTTMCVSLMMLPYVCPHATTNLVMFSFFALGCSDGQTRQLSNDLRGLLSFFFYLFFLFSFFFAVKEPLIILNEYCSGGNLEDYLLQKRKGGRSSKPWIPPPTQVSVPVSCVCGCERWGCAPCLCLCRCCLRVRACA